MPVELPGLLVRPVQTSPICLHDPSARMNSRPDAESAGSRASGENRSSPGSPRHHKHHRTESVNHPGSGFPRKQLRAKVSPSDRKPNADSSDSLFFRSCRMWLRTGMSQPDSSALEFSGIRARDRREDADERSFDERNSRSPRRSCRIYNSKSQFADSPETSLPGVV